MMLKEDEHMKKFVFILLAILIFLTTACKGSNDDVLTVDFLVDNEIFYSTQYTNEAITPPIPEKEGFVFIKWDKDYTNVTTDLTINAIFEEETTMIRITMESGAAIDLELYADIAPITVNNFLELVRNKYYDGICFHRIIKNFMAQAGGYYIEGNTIMEKDSDIPTITGEFSLNGHANDLHHELGVISMARTREYNSASAQFFICTANAPHLDGSYAAFGKVVGEESFAALKELGNSSTTVVGQLTDFPYPVQVIKTIRIIDEKK